MVGFNLAISCTIVIHVTKLADHCNHSCKVIPLLKDIGRRGFSAAATSGWNSLPEAVYSATSPELFRETLKTELFMQSYTG